jgi:hypothetical protein
LNPGRKLLMLTQSAKTLKLTNEKRNSPPMTIERPT